ncbi:DUF3040 domain-containing protein [Pseudarthrobacter sp. SL88]|uniref:DUF3040 domain-containing protein n=1 Tax=Pseudarthrobacter sp. SL88 TaxID=2994666 RepID=UPI00227695B1|nr:DUF3040 domain-containing protein [Pseudarthrobacter sp. SL88]MCY1676229.1 DUF3040 domain-containing protein [Pseudarthrobacter sp. SL88]
MPMSEEERRLLKELELGLIADDPHLAMELLSGYPSRRIPPGLVPGCLVCLLAFAIVAAGIGSQELAAVVVGLMLLVLGSCLLLNRPATGRGPQGGRATG